MFMEMDTPSLKSKRILSKKRRRRTIINSTDLEKLESLFKTAKWPDRVQKERLSKAIGKSENFISTWFQNRRARMRRLARQKDILDDVDISNSSINLDDNNTISDDVNKENMAVKRLHKYRSRSVPPIHLLKKMGCPENSENELNTSAEDEGEQPKKEKISKSDEKGGGNESKTRNFGMKNHESTTAQTIVTKGPNDVIPSERRVFVETPSYTNSNDATSWDNVFRRIIDMMAASESIMSKSDTSYPFAVKDAALGIRLKDGKIFYSKEYGLDFEDCD